MSDLEKISADLRGGHVSDEEVEDARQIILDKLGQLALAIDELEYYSPHIARLKTGLPPAEVTNVDRVMDPIRDLGWRIKAAQEAIKEHAVPS